MIIRPIAPTDEKKWCPLWDAYLAFYETELSEEVTQNAWTAISGKNNSCGGFVAEHDGEIIGFVHYLFHASTWSINGYCYLEDLFVSEAGRGKGVGRALIEAVYAEADHRNCERVYWITNADNITAQKLYDNIAEKSDFIQYRSTRP